MSCTDLPVREISSQADLEQFLGGETFARLFEFLQRLSRAVRGRPVSSVSLARAPARVQWACQLLEQMDRAIGRHPPDTATSTSRYGNPRFRDWLDEMRILLPQAHHKQTIPNADQVASYLLNSLGDRQRIDYGTGHEAHLLAWLHCLAHPATGPFLPSAPGMEDEIGACMVLLIFARYLALMRALQTTYWLEPAGSHGVWGLDDYHFLPFLWGASQLSGTLGAGPSVHVLFTNLACK